MRQAKSLNELAGYTRITRELPPTDDNIDYLDVVARDLAGADTKWYRDDLGRLSVWRRTSETMDGQKHQYIICKEVAPPTIPKVNHRYHKT